MNVMASEVPKHKPRDVLKVLGSIPLLQRLPAATIAEIAQVGQIKHFGTGELLVKEGELADGLYIILKGEADFLETSSEGKERHSLHKGYYFGHVCGSPRKRLHEGDVIAISEVTCFVVYNEHTHLLTPASSWRNQPGELSPVERLLQLDLIEVDVFQSRPMVEAPTFWDNMYGGHMVSLALAATSKTVDPALLVHSLHSNFIRAANPSLSIMFKVDRARDSHTFATRHVQATQRGKIMFTMYASYQRASKEKGLEHQDPMPSTPSPDELPTYEDTLRPLCKDTRLSKYNRNASTASLQMGETLDLRYYNRRSLTSLEPQPPRQRVWVRTKGKLSDDQALQRCGAAYALDWSLLETALGPHNKVVNTYAITGLSLDHSMWFHGSFRADEWLHVVMESPKASNTRALCFGRVYTQSGELVISLAQEGTIRVFPSPREHIRSSKL